MNSIRSAAEKVVSFTRLPAGWNYGEGRPAENGAVVSALRTLEILHRHGLDAADAFPGADGEVMIAIYRDAHCMEIVFNTDGLIDFTVEAGGTPVVEADGITERELDLRLIGLVGRLWNSSGSSTPGISIRRAANSQAWRSRTPREGASRSFSWSASRRAEFPSVTTSHPTIRNG